MNNKRNIHSRRGFIAKATSGFIGSATLLGSTASANDKNQVTLSGIDDHRIYSPLDKLTINVSEKMNISVYDGGGNNYMSSNGSTNSFQFLIGGVLGTHIVVVEDKKGKILLRKSFNVDAQTMLRDDSDTYAKLFRQLYWTMIGSSEGADMGRGGEAFPFMVEGKFYFTFVPWLRDHVHTLKGMKYFYPNIKSAIDLFAKYQREDGLVWDNFGRRRKEPSMWDKRFSDGGFIMPVDDYKFEFKRIPVEADMEFIFIEGIYFTWQATGDTQWMIGKLDNALRAVSYCTSDPYRWSTKYQLVKRGFTIDTWDFQGEEDSKVVGDDHMRIDKDKTNFGIMYGDNTGLINACQKLVIMLNLANRKDEAIKIAKLAADLQQRLDALAWNGEFYTHHVSENPEIKRDLGVDLNQSFSLSNSYSINRNIGHDKSVKIINKYKELYKSKPSNGLGEWYGIYPPFPKGFGDTSVWEYVNGGVLSLVAGELAHGAFEHGEEAYAVDILNRVSALASKYNDFLHGAFKGRIPQKPERTFEPIALDKLANVNFSGEPSQSATPWTNEGKNDLHEMVVGKQTFLEIPFQISDPKTNSGRGCIGISDGDGYLPKAILPVDKNAASIYFLHIKAGPSAPGFIKVVYQDLTTHLEEINDQKIDGWWMPNNKSQFKVAWKGTNYKAPFVGVGIYGWNNPFPDKKIKEIVFENGKNKDTKWFVLGVTLSTAKVFFEPDARSKGIPDRWGAAAVMYALAEGLVGATDTGMTFESARISPRWAATTETEIDTVFRYASSNGYVAYKYRLNNANSLSMEVATSAKIRNYEVLIPVNKSVSTLKCNGQTTSFELKKVQNSVYVCWKEDNLKCDTIEIILV